MPRLCRPHRLLLAASLLWSLQASADYSTDQIGYAASGRYDLLEKSILDRGTEQRLGTRDLHALCFAYSKTKQYTQLFSCLDQLESSVRSGDRRTRLFGLEDATPTIYLMRAEALIELARYPEAIAQAEKAERWLKDDDSDDLDMVSNALATLSLAHTLNGDEDNGWKYERQLRAVPISKFGDYATAKAMALARCRMALRDYEGVIAAIRGDSAFALNVFLDKLVSGSFLTGVNNWVWVELPRAFMLNKALFETGQISEARAGFDRLLGIEQVRENGEIYWLLLQDRGRIAEAENQAEPALRYYREAIDVIERQRASINTEASKIGFVGDKQQLYSRLIALAQQAGKIDLALEYIERAKSRALIDLLAIRDNASQGIARSPDSLAALQRFQLAQQSAAIQRPVDMAAGSSGKSRQAVLEQARSLQANDPNLASLVTVQALSANEIRHSLRKDEALLEFFGVGPVMYGLAINQGQQQLLRIDAQDLEATVRAFRKAIQEQSPEAAALAKQLHGKLIQPFATTLAQRNLLIVPHGPLHYLPFAALQDGTQTLLASRSLRFLPSTSVQKYIRPHSQTGAGKMLIFGNPDLGNAKFDLPSAEEEAKTIAALLPDSRILTRKQATETAFKAQARDFNFLHIASHGQFKSDNALESRLLLAPDSSNDGSLTVNELYSSALNADLVTLSACETGLGKTLSGDDVLGLNRGFLYAGASNIVSSLWEVDDEATSQLMQAFYRQLKNGSTKQEALRQAQLQLRKNFPDPIFWAAFYLTGEGI